jgi:hypothetical protein
MATKKTQPADAVVPNKDDAEKQAQNPESDGPQMVDAPGNTDTSGIYPTEENPVPASDEHQ